MNFSDTLVQLIDLGAPSEVVRRLRETGSKLGIDQGHLTDASNVEVNTVGPADLPQMQIARHEGESRTAFELRVNMLLHHMGYMVVEIRPGSKQGHTTFIVAPLPADLPR